MKRMLFNATHPEELRVAIADGQKLIDLDIESAIRKEKKGNIYKATITKVEPSLEACFVDYGAERHGFLPLKEIYRNYFNAFDPGTQMSDIKIESVIKAGQEVVVQVDKDERGTKGAALTTFISLAGRFLVLMPNNPKGGGISRRIVKEARTELKQALKTLEVNTDHALIARTAGIGRTTEELQWDLDFLLKLWDTINTASQEIKAPYLIYQESNLIVRAIRDHLTADISEVVVDDPEIHDRVHRFMSQVMPHSSTKLKKHRGSIPLFSKFHIETQIESAFDREVNLPSGGSLVIDHTEALISIDVNSARATKGGDIEETALQTNLEAVDEIARQLRIRDLGGLIVIDLIDMNSQRHQQAVVSRLKVGVQPDRARVQIGQISRFGLLEMSRQRLRSSISDANYGNCPRCHGIGTIRNVVSTSLSVLRMIEEDALKENTEAIQAILPLDIATYLINEKRYELNQLETKLATRIIILPSDAMLTPDFEIRRLKSEEMDQLSQFASYKQKPELEKHQDDLTVGLKSSPGQKAKIQLDHISHRAPPLPQDQPAEEGNSKKGVIKRITEVLFGRNSETEHEKTPKEKKRSDKPSHKDTPGNRTKEAKGRRRTRTPQTARHASQGNKPAQSGGRDRKQPAKSTANRKPGPPKRTRHTSDKSTAQPDNPQTAKPTRDRGKVDKKNMPKKESPEVSHAPANPDGKPSKRRHPQAKNPASSLTAAETAIPDDIGNRKE